MSTLAAEAAEAAAEPTNFLHVTQVINLVVIAFAVVVLARRRTTQPSPATDWALAMFAILGSVVVAGFFTVEDDGSMLRHGYTVVLVGVLLLVPYLLVRFAYALGAVSARVHQFAVVATVAQLACTLVSPTFPEPGEPRSGWFTAYVILILAGWTLQSFAAAYGLWTAGNGQPSVVAAADAHSRDGRRGHRACVDHQRRVRRGEHHPAGHHHPDGRGRRSSCWSSRSSCLPGCAPRGVRRTSRSWARPSVS